MDMLVIGSFVLSNEVDWHVRASDKVVEHVGSAFGS
jgi:hypothetical protein